MKNKKRVFLSLLIIAGISVLAIAATRAFFTARRTQSGNKFTMGTLDLTVGSSPKTDSFVVNNIGEDGRITGQKVWAVKNTGTLPGRMFVRLRNLVNKENGCNDQEKVAEPDCTANDEGEMGSKLKAGFYYNPTAPSNNDVANMTLVGSLHDLATANIDTYGADWNARTPIVIQPNQTVYFGMKWDANSADYGNEIQSDSLAFEVETNLVQATALEPNLPTPTNTGAGENTTGL